MATVTVHRGSKTYGGLRKVKVVLDEQTVGAIGRNDSVRIPVAPGQHVLYVKMDWARSPELTIVAGDGDLTIDVEMPGVFEGTWKSFLQPRNTFGLAVRP